MRLSARRLFSTFPSGPAGAGLLLLRAVLGVVIVLGTHHVDGFLAAGGLLLLAGFLTPLVGAGIAGWLIVAQYVNSPRDVSDLSVVLLIGGCLALVLLGPGAWSMDAWMFGRREIVIPRRRF